MTGELKDNSYWVESVGQSLDEAGLVATEAQIERIADDMSICCDQHDMAFGFDVASQNLAATRRREVAALRRELAEERDKVVCGQCHGRGLVVMAGPCHSSEST